MDECFRPAQRIRRRSDYQKAYREGAKVNGRLMTLYLLPNGLDVGRLGVAATRRFGGAVERNRAKRRIRELFRRTGATTVGFDVVVIPRRPLLDATVAELKADYLKSIDRRTSHDRSHSRRPPR